MLPYAFCHLKLKEPKRHASTVEILPLQPEKGRACTLPIFLLCACFMPLSPPMKCPSAAVVSEEHGGVRNSYGPGGAGVLNHFVHRLKKKKKRAAAVARAAPSTGRREQRDQRVMADYNF